MTARSEVKREEVERITRTAGYYVTPERLAEMMGTAQKILRILSGSRVPFIYSDCEIILDLVRSAMDRVKGD